MREQKEKKMEQKVMNFDLVVVGGGQAGCAAALAGAREGLSVLLVEASGALGGSAVTALVNPYMPWQTKVTDADGKERILELSAGIFHEMYEALCEDGLYSPPEKSAVFHEESMKIIYDRKMAEAGVNVLFHAMLCGVKTEGRKIKSISVATIGGVYEFEAESFVDATGDATVAAYSGAGFRLGRPADSMCQPMTLCFRVGNLDVHDIWAHGKEVHKLYVEQQAAGKIKNPRENVLVFGTRIPRVTHFNTTRIVRHNPTDPFSVSKAEALAREQVLEMVTLLRENFEWAKDAQLLNTASTIGTRESRMIEARHELTAEELVACTKFADGIAAGNYDIDIHSPDGAGTSHYYFPAGQYYTIPYRSMVPVAFDNFLVAGRSIGATHEAQASIRIMPICCCLGEAAGIAAAVAKEKGVLVADVDVEQLRLRIRARGGFCG